MFSPLYLLTRKGRLSRSKAKGLYALVVRQSRNPVFYEDYGVPDTVEGRFEMVTLHTGLLVSRLCRGDAGQDGKLLAQAVFDAMFGNIDWAMREMGIGDLGVPRRIKKMMGQFKGRTYAYDESVRSGDGDLKLVLSRNIYATLPAIKQEYLDKMASYVQDCVVELNKQDMAGFWQGQVVFPIVNHREPSGQSYAEQAA